MRLPWRRKAGRHAGARAGSVLQAPVTTPAFLPLYAAVEAPVEAPVEPAGSGVALVFGDGTGIQLDPEDPRVRVFRTVASQLIN